MQVNDVLDKLVTDQPDAIAVLVRMSDGDYENLKAPYDIISAEDVLEIVGDVFTMTDSLEDEGFDIGDMILSFDEHAVVSRKVDGGSIVVLTRALGRPQLIKLQVSLGLYVRALEKAMANGKDVPGVTESNGSANHGTQDEPSLPAESAHQAEPAIRGWLGRAFGGGNGNGNGNGSANAQLKASEADIAAAKAEGKKPRFYRGQVYYD